jgi:DNA-binding NtrC family response regulator
MKDPITVLFVDDEPGILRFIRRQLREETLEVLMAGSGEEALDILATRRVDVLVSDLEMPGMNGLELVRAARKRFPGTLRMLLTGAATLEVTLEAINQGEVARFLRKPFDPEAFRAMVGCLSDRIRRNRDDEQARSSKVRRDQFVSWIERRYPGITHVPRDDGGRVSIDVNRRLLAADGMGSSAREALFRWTSFNPKSGPHDTMRSPTSH